MFHWKCENTEVSELVVVVFCLTSALFVPLDLLFSMRFPDQQEKKRYQTKLSQNGKCKTCSRESTLIAPCLPTLPVFLGVSKFSMTSPGLPVRAPNLPGNTCHMAFFKIFSFISLFLRCQKGKYNKKWIWCSFLSWSRSENVKQPKTEQTN